MQRFSYYCQEISYLFTTTTFTHLLSFVLSVQYFKKAALLTRAHADSLARSCQQSWQVSRGLTDGSQAASAFLNIDSFLSNKAAAQLLAGFLEAKTSKKIRDNLFIPILILIINGNYSKIDFFIRHNQVIVLMHT